MKNKIKLHFDNIIYTLQKKGGISRFWMEITSRVISSQNYDVLCTKSSKLSKYFPVDTHSDIFHSSYYRVPFKKRVKTIVTVHDFLYQHGFVKNLNSPFHIAQMTKSILSADAVICVSEHTKRDLLTFFPELKYLSQIYVIYHGSTISSNLNNYNNPSIRTENFNKIQSMINTPYILFLGQRVKHKNFKTALLSFYQSSLPKLDFSLVCVSPDFNKPEQKELNKLNLSQKVFTINNVSDTEIQMLYKNAFALLYPSLYEGFGIPPLEAMSYGCPVIASNSSSIPEVVGNAGILIEPNDVFSFSNALDSLLNDKIRNTYKTLSLDRATLFSWDKAAEQYMNIYNALSLN